MTQIPDDVSESKPQSPEDMGESSIDIMLDRVDLLASNTRFIKHWHITQLPEDDVSELSITFLDICDGSIDTAP